jgi:hypothetical protein
VSTLAQHVRPRPAGPVAASLAFAWRSLLKIKHVPEQLGDVIGIPILFTLLFTYLFGGALTGSTQSYLQLLLPGTLALAVVFVTVYSGVTLNRDLTTGAFDRFRTLPIWRPALIVGALIGDLGRYLLAAGLVIGLGLAMGYHAGGGTTGVLTAIALVLLFASALSWGWTTLGLVLRSPTAVLNSYTNRTNQLVEMCPPPGGVYAVPHGHGKIIWTRHRPGMITQWPPYVTSRRRRSRSPAVVLAHLGPTTWFRVTHEPSASWSQWRWLTARTPLRTKSCSYLARATAAPRLFSLFIERVGASTGGRARAPTRAPSSGASRLPRCRDLLRGRDRAAASAWAIQAAWRMG